MSDLMERIAARVVVTPAGCWEWQGARSSKGYGVKHHAGRQTTITRLVAAELLGLALDDRATHVCHSCDNPPCVNPTHLFLGSNLDNVRDAFAKGRRGPQVFCKRGHDIEGDATPVGDDRDDLLLRMSATDPARAGSPAPDSCIPLGRRGAGDPPSRHLGLHCTTK